MKKVSADSAIDLASRPAISLILTGDDYLLGALRLRSHRALYTRIACHYHLTPWTPNEITQLLQASQQAVGLSDTLIDTAAIDIITHTSQGLVRTTLQVARQPGSRKSS